MEWSGRLRKSFGLLSGAAVFLSERAFTVSCVDAGDNRFVKLRTGDRAILIGAAAIIAYEKYVADDEDLISRRVAAYQQKAPWTTTLVVLVTALHLLSVLDTRVDPYHQAVKYFRRHVGAQE